MIQRSFIVFTIIQLVVFHEVQSFPGGAPPSACSSLTPGHGVRLSGANPFKITVQRTSRGLSVRLTSDDKSEFEGFILQARKVGSDSPIGSFTQLPVNTKAAKCTNDKDTATHSNTIKKQDLTFVWSPPENFKDKIVFRATVAVNYGSYWLGITSEEITLALNDGVQSTTTSVIYSSAMELISSEAVSSAPQVTSTAAEPPSSMLPVDTSIPSVITPAPPTSSLIHSQATQSKVPSPEVISTIQPSAGMVPVVTKLPFVETSAPVQPATKQYEPTTSVPLSVQSPSSPAATLSSSRLTQILQSSLPPMLSHPSIVFSVSQSSSTIAVEVPHMTQELNTTQIPQPTKEAPSLTKLFTTSLMIEKVNNSQTPIAISQSSFSTQMVNATTAHLPLPLTQQLNGTGTPTTINILPSMTKVVNATELPTIVIRPLSGTIQQPNVTQTPTTTVQLPVMIQNTTVLSEEVMMVSSVNGSLQSPFPTPQSSTIEVQSTILLRENQSVATIQPFLSTMSQMTSQSPAINITSSPVGSPTTSVQPTMFMTTPRPGRLTNFSVELTIDGEFSSELQNKSSKKFKAMASRLEDEIERVYREDGQNVLVTVKGFRQGSIIAEVILSFSSPSSEPLSALLTAAENNSLNNLTIVPSSIKFTGCIPSCPQQADCQLGSIPSCVCKEGFTGDGRQCTGIELEKDEDDTDEIKTLLVASLIIVAIILFVVLLCFFILLVKICKNK